MMYSRYAKYYPYKVLIISCYIAVNILLLGCQSERSFQTKTLYDVVSLQLADKQATKETTALFYNLRKLAKNHTLFGHQEDTKSGYEWINAFGMPSVSTQRSDVKEVTGAYPAVYGWDFMNIINFYTGAEKIYETNIIRTLTIEAYNRGGINTYSWHFHNPVTKEGIWWRDAQVEAVKHILPGGTHHTVYKTALQELAFYAKSLVGGDGKLIPVIFRPFHEMDGDWFWWGKGHCTVQEYKSLYQFTVSYLKDSLQVHNFLYAWSPDRNFSTEAQYLEFYPGDEYVDVVGIDNYIDMAIGNDPKLAGDKLKVVSNYAIHKNKIAAFTETGLDKIPQADWFTQMLLPVLQRQNAEVAYVMVWSNTKDMFWTPYKGHPAEKDFIQFKNHPYILFNDKTPSIYNFN